MKLLRPHVNRLQATTRLPAAAIRANRLHSRHQQPQGKAAETAPRLARNNAVSTAASGQAPVRTAPVCRGTSCRPAHDTALLPTKHHQAFTARRASHSAKAIVAEEPTIHDVFESKTGTWQYVVADPSTLAAVIIDPVLDYDPATQAITTDMADALLSLVEENNYKVDRILETHCHADHLSAASYLQNRLARKQGHKPPIGIGKRIGNVQRLFGQRYGVPEEEYEGVFVKLFDDDETFSIGGLKATAVHLPGHTPDHLGYKIGDNVFCGDSLFHADIGTARCDFPGGSAKDLFNSGRKLLSLPDHVRIWTGHDYPPDERSAPVPWISVRDHKMHNRHLKDGITEEEFVALRKERDAKLGEPRLLHQSIQTNIRAGRLPKPRDSGHRLLHLPLKLKGVEW